ncbi:MAG: putative RNase H-like nuclease [Candidatus Azotimanducaceae bacterium]
MSLAANAVTPIVGVDGCAGGWVAATFHSISVFNSIDALIEHFPAQARILIDMPMGLPEIGPRDLEVKARQCLPKGKSSSVFAIPCRRAIYADDYRRACAINLDVQGKKFSIQTWNICRKICELDRLLLAKPALTKRVFESHPELAFAVLAGGQALPPKKKIEGFEARLLILSEYIQGVQLLVETALSNYRRATLAKDDVLDALVLAVTGSMEQTILNDSADRDEKGIPIRMLIPAVR